VLNTLYQRGKGKNARDWAFHFFPLLTLESYHEDHFKWKVLLGLLGRERNRELARWQIFGFWTDPK
jgi:hypothetical protein